MDQITKQLKHLGFGDHEALVYETLLKASPSNATSIAKKCNLSRSSVYTTLSSLISKGLVGTTYKNDVKQFIAEDYSTLELLLKKEKDTLNDKFKTLESLKDSIGLMRTFSNAIPQIVFFEGQEGLKKIYLSMMKQAKNNETLYLLRDEFVWQPAWKFIFEEDWHTKVKKIKIEKNIRTKLLINDSKIENDHKKFYRLKKGLEQRFLSPKHHVKQFALYIIGDTVSILSVEENNLIGIKIINKAFSDNFKTMFEVMWKSGK